MSWILAGDRCVGGGCPARGLLLGSVVFPSWNVFLMSLFHSSLLHIFAKRYSLIFSQVRHHKISNLYSVNNATLLLFFSCLFIIHEHRGALVLSLSLSNPLFPPTHKPITR